MSGDSLTPADAEAAQASLNPDTNESFPIPMTHEHTRKKDMQIKG